MMLSAELVGFFSLMMNMKLKRAKQGGKFCILCCVFEGHVVCGV